MPSESIPTGTPHARDAKASGARDGGSGEHLKITSDPNLADANRAPLLDRALLERLERLTLRWRQSFPGLLGGHNRSRFAGGGQEFLDHRQFHHGDDLRSVNWRAYMRLEKLFLKMFQIEPRVPVVILLDVSKSMASSDEKFLFARRLAAALCYLGLLRLEKMSVFPFSNQLGQGMRCGGGRHRYGPLADYLGRQEPEGETSFFSVAREFISENQQRGVVFLISDFLDDGDCLKPLQYLADFGHELFLVQVWSDDERTPSWIGDLDLIDAETGDELRLEVDGAACHRYTEAFDEHARHIEGLAQSNGGRYVGLASSTPIEEALFSTLGGAVSVGTLRGPD